VCVLRISMQALALCALSVPFLAAPQMAAAQLGGIVTGEDVERVVELARAYGPAERRHDDAGDGPWIRAEMDGVVYTISFLNCTDGVDCRSVQFRAWWESEGAHTIAQMNQWNRDRRFSAAYLDSDMNATVEFDVNLTGGVTAVNFDDTLQWWATVLREFTEEVIDPGFAGAAGNAPVLQK